MGVDPHPVMAFYSAFSGFDSVPDMYTLIGNVVEGVASRSTSLGVFRERFTRQYNWDLGEQSIAMDAVASLQEAIITFLHHAGILYFDEIYLDGMEHYALRIRIHRWT